MQSPAQAQGSQAQNLDRHFQSAEADYEAGKLPQAASQLEELATQAPKSFEIHELLGLVYAAESQDAKAEEHLQLAVRLNPKSLPARTNLAACLSHEGKVELAGQEFQKAHELGPEDYDANHNLGEFYVQTGKIAAAIPYLEQAQRTKPSYGNGYDLALAWFLTGHLDEARSTAQTLAKQEDKPELHTLLGQIDEKDGKFIEAANELQTAARMDPSEENLFAWGSELLLHRTYEPAIAVFQQATQSYPKSARLRIGLGVAYYSWGKYEEAVKSLLAAADLDPSDPRCYYFLSKAYDSSPAQAEEVAQSFRRFSELQPNNALACYYYAMSLWKGKRVEDQGTDLQQVESVLQKSIALDPKLAEPHVLLGNLYADQHDYTKSIPEFERAVELNPKLPDAHYRLSQDYLRTGQKDRAKAELDIYQQLHTQYMAALDKQANEVQQFVYSARTATTAKP
jgi:tetratricopeptide (TPR) repeat protein